MLNKPSSITRIFLIVILCALIGGVKILQIEASAASHEEDVGSLAQYNPTINQVLSQNIFEPQIAVPVERRAESPDLTPDNDVFLPALFGIAASIPTPTPTPTPTSIPDDLPCLMIVKKIYSDIDLYAGCLQNAVKINTQLEYDQFGRINKMFLDYLDLSDTLIYSAVMTLEYDQFARISEYSGPISGPDFPAFTQNLLIEYNSQGSIVSQKGNKTYDASGSTYSMNVYEICGGTYSPTTGYKVKVTGNGLSDEDFTVGSCS